MVNVFVYHFFLFARFGVKLSIPNYFDASVGTRQFTFLTTRATVHVVLVVGHDHFTAKTLKHFQGSPVLRILLGYGTFSGMQKVLSGNTHSRKK